MSRRGSSWTSIRTAPQPRSSTARETGARGPQQTSKRQRAPEPPRPHRRLGRRRRRHSSPGTAGPKPGGTGTARPGPSSARNEERRAPNRAGASPAPAAGSGSTRSIAGPERRTAVPTPGGSISRSSHMFWFDPRSTRTTGLAPVGSVSSSRRRCRPGTPASRPPNRAGVSRGVKGTAGQPCKHREGSRVPRGSPGRPLLPLRSACPPASAAATLHRPSGATTPAPATGSGSTSALPGLTS